MHTCNLTGRSVFGLFAVTLEKSMDATRSNSVSRRRPRALAIYNTSQSRSIVGQLLVNLGCRLARRASEIESSHPTR